MYQPDDDEGILYWETVGRFWPWMFGFVVAILSSAFYSEYGAPGLLALLALPLMGLIFWRRRMAVRVDSTGLTELLWPSGERHHWWSSIREIDERRRSLRLVCDDGVLRFGRMFLNRRAVALAARRAKQGRGDRPLDAGQITERLGGQAVRLKAVGINRVMARIFPWFLGGIMTIAFLGILSDALRGKPDALQVVWGFGFGLPLILAWLRQQGRSIQRQMVGEAVADASGIELQTGVGRIFVPWADVGGAELWAANNTLYLSTLAGDFQIQSFALAKLRAFADAVERVVAARDQGAELPRMEGAGDASLSLAEDDNESAIERGLSRLEG